MVVIKLQYKDDIRRVTVDHLLNFSELRTLAQSLFENSLPSSYVFKYKDDEGDLITVSSDRELSEAFRLVKDQEIVRISIFAQQENKPNVNANANANQGSEKSFIDVLLETVQGNPFLRDLLNNLEIEVKSVPESLKREFGFNESQGPQSEVCHQAMCDGCNAQIRGIRYKCKSCPDYDLCEKCYDIKGVHIPAEHQFEKILRPTRPACPVFQRRPCHFRQQSDIPQSEVVHPATCDGCGSRIKGIRHKCNDCLDYDLCQACKEKNIHSEHSFTALLRPTMQCQRPFTQCNRNQECSNPKAEETKPAQTSAPVTIPVQIPVKVEQPTPKPVSVPQPQPIKVESVPKVEQPAPVPTPAPVVSQPTPAPLPTSVPTPAPAPKVPETILQAPSPKEDRPLSPFEMKLKQLEEMGFLNRAKNVELMVKHSGDMVRIVRDLLDA